MKQLHIITQPTAMLVYVLRNSLALLSKICIMV
jgi:hypothetical protein